MKKLIIIALLFGACTKQTIVDEIRPINLKSKQEVIKAQGWEWKEGPCDNIY